MLQSIPAAVDHLLIAESLFHSPSVGSAKNTIRVATAGSKLKETDLRRVPSYIVIGIGT